MYAQYEPSDYEATVTEHNTGTSETYTGLTARRFKDRLYEYTKDMNNQHNKGTTLRGAFKKKTTKFWTCGKKGGGQQLRQTF